jgi:hypothetical protein
MQQPTTSPAQDGRPPVPPHIKRLGRVRRFIRGYLMVAGALATLAGLTLLIVSLFVRIQDLIAP